MDTMKFSGKTRTESDLIGSKEIPVEAPNNNAQYVTREEFAKMIQSWGGVVNETNLMGRKQFAREIKKRKAGVYVNFVFELDAEKETQIREQYRLDDRVLRIMIILFDRPDNVRSTLAAIDVAE